MDLMSVRQNLEFYSGVYGLTGALRRERIDEMIETFELQRYLKESPDTLPLGFKQRLALACALMHRPLVLFLDEPTSGVDPITRREFWTHINGLARKGVTAMVTTHFMDEAEYCDRLALMYQAKVIAMGSPDELKAGVANRERPDPTMEDAFIGLVEARRKRKTQRGMRQTFSFSRLVGLVYKESLQVIRDPSAILVTFALPTVMMLVFAFALSLDQTHVPIGIVLETDGADAQSLAAAFSSTDYFDVTAGARPERGGAARRRRTAARIRSHSAGFRHAIEERRSGPRWCRSLPTDRSQTRQISWRPTVAASSQRG